MTNKKLIPVIVVAAVVLVVIGGLYAWWQTQKLVPQQETQNNQTTGTVPQNSGENPGPAGTTGTSGSTGTTAKLAYTIAVKNYEGRRIQFNDQCVATPNYATYKAGTSIMLDNRSAAAKRLSVGGAVYNIAAYDYQIVTLTAASKLPYTVNIDCGTGQQNARILLQQ